MRKDNYDITFIVPIYNTKSSIIQRCVNSVTQINKISYEIIIIDDGSEQHIATYCDSIAEATKNCRCIHQHNKGVSAARNVGMMEAKGKYFYFIDSDDVIFPAAFCKKIHSEYQLIFTDLVVEMKPFSGKWDAFCGQSRVITINDVLQKLSHDGKLNGPVAKLIDAEFIRKNEIFFREDMVSGEDAVFLMDLLAHNPSMYYSKADSYCYYRNPSTSTNRLLTHTETVIRNNIMIYQSMMRLIRQNSKVLENEYENLCVSASERFVKQIFNTAVELSEFHLLYESNRKLLTESLTEISPTLKKRFSVLIKMRNYIISEQLWKILKLIANIRNIYLRLKFGEK